MQEVYYKKRKPLCAKTAAVPSRIITIRMKHCTDRRGQIIRRVSIDDRPLIVEEKSRIGDFEGDLVIGKNHKGALATLVDRHSKFSLIAKVPNKSANNVTAAIIAMLHPIKEHLHTITFDNGKDCSPSNHGG